MVAGLEWLLCGGLGFTSHRAMFSCPEDICSPSVPGGATYSLLSSAPTRTWPLHHREVCFLFLFSFSSVGQIGKSQQELGHGTCDNGLHRSHRVAEHLGRGPESRDLQGSEGPGLLSPSTLERSLKAAPALCLEPAVQQHRDLSMCYPDSRLTLKFTQ